MWKVTRFPLVPTGEDIRADRLFLGWRHILAYRNTELIDLIENKKIHDGPLDGCSLSRERCAIRQGNQCLVLGLYDASVIDIPVTDVQQISMLERDRLALRTGSEVVIYDLKAKRVINEWPLKCSTISAGFDHLIALSNEGEVFCWGDGSRGQQGSANLEFSDDLSPVEALEGVSISKIAAGGWHSAALSSRGLVYLWGWNQHGQINGPLSSEQTQQNKASSANIVYPTLREVSSAPIVDIACGSRHSVALDERCTLWSWGWNAYGQCDLTVDQRTLNATRGLKGEASSIERTFELSTEETEQTRGENTTGNRTLRTEFDSPLKVTAAFWTTALEYSIIAGINTG